MAKCSWYECKNDEKSVRNPKKIVLCMNHATHMCYFKGRIIPRCTEHIPDDQPYYVIEEEKEENS